MKTNRTLKLITLTAAIFGFAATSFGQIASDEAAANAGAKIIAPITIDWVRHMYFGAIIKTTGANVVTLSHDATAVREATVAESLLAAQTGNPTSAQFSIAGEEAFTFSVGLPSSITIEGPGEDMTVDNLTMNLSATSNTFGASPTTLYVGGDLNVGANQTVGAYTGTFTVTVAYN